jgi:V8-like Glu-specific endopeptidase
MPGTTANLRLSGKQYMQLVDAILDAFREGDLRMCLLFHLELRYDNIIQTPSTFPQRVRDVIEVCERADRVADLIQGLRESNSTNRVLKQAADAILGPQATGIVLQKIVREHGTAFRNGEEYRKEMAAAEARVCRIETGPHEPVGTGFLIGPDLVLTCHHVVAGRPLSLLRFRFDARVITEDNVTGRVVHAGTNETPTGVVTHTGLDFAVIRLAENASKHLVGQYQDAPVRGWQPLKPVEAKANDAVGILQHPNGSQLVFAEGGVHAIQGDRLQYVVNTEPGSSGSPVFDSDWQVVAVHRNAGMQTYNEGTRIAPILKLVPTDILKS